MASSTRVKAVFLDDTSVETTTRHYMCTSDRAAFERQFNASSGELFVLAQSNGNGRSSYREEWVAFFAWRVLQREAGYGGDYEQFVENTASIELKDLDAPNPTEQEAPTG